MGGPAHVRMVKSIRSVIKMTIVKVLRALVEHQVGAMNRRVSGVTGKLRVEEVDQQADHQVSATTDSVLLIMDKLFLIPILMMLAAVVVVFSLFVQRSQKKSYFLLTICTANQSSPILSARPLLMYCAGITQRFQMGSFSCLSKCQNMVAAS